MVRGLAGIHGIKTVVMDVAKVACGKPLPDAAVRIVAIAALELRVHRFPANAVVAALPRPLAAGRGLAARQAVAAGGGLQGAPWGTPPDRASPERKEHKYLIY
jgi:hypothetical protein